MVNYKIKIILLIKYFKLIKYILYNLIKNH